MRHSQSEKMEIIRIVEGSSLGVKRTLVELDINRSTFYAWYRRYADGGYEPIIDALSEINVDRFAMEFAAPESHGIDVLARFPENKILGLGVIDQVDTNVETPEIVIDRVEAALEHVRVDRLTLNPDCGFSPGAQNPMDIDEAFLKLSAMSAAADVLRQRHG